MPLGFLIRDARNIFSKDELNQEITTIALPAAMALAADPIASLIDTAFLGHIGHVELAAVGVAIAVFNQVSKIAIFPLVSITTSFVAEEDASGSLSNKLEEIEIIQRYFTAENEHDESVPMLGTSNGTWKVENREPKQKHIPSASLALLIGAFLGLSQALFLIFSAKPILNYMGIKSDSPMLHPARQYLTVRSLGAPAVLLSLAMQGVFRGFKDTKTPLFATVVGDLVNVILDPIFIYVLRMGVTGAAIAHVVSQYLMSLILLWKLMGEVYLLPPSIAHLQFGRFLKNGFLLLLRVIAATFCVTLSASLAARLGTTSMAAFQICLQVWLATSLLADGLAIAGQAILASAFARKDFVKATSTAARVLQVVLSFGQLMLGLALGLVLSVIVAMVLHFALKLFTEDVNVIQVISSGIPFVIGTQPINSLAFVFDGVNYGASDFHYSAYSMILVSSVSILCLIVLASSYGFVGIWLALSIFMTLRALAGFWRIGTGTGPWSFLVE